jgi:hypothetical protein
MSTSPNELSESLLHYTTKVLFFFQHVAWLERRQKCNAAYVTYKSGIDASQLLIETNYRMNYASACGVES